MQNVVLFGAGASAFSKNVLPKAPPLGRSLYSELVEQYPVEWGVLSHELKSAFECDFEAGMVALMNCGDLDTFYSCMRTLSVYFSQFRVDAGANDLYSMFLRAIGERGLLSHTLFSTLNYECILESAAEGLAIQVRHPDQPPSPHQAAVWKLHGACNILPPPVEMQFEDVKVDGIPLNRFLLVDGPLTAVPRDSVQYHLEEFTTLFSVMAMYAPGKEASFAPSVFAGLQHHWSRMVLTARLVLVIGVKFTPEDHHIWEPLTSTPATVLFVGSEASFRDWTSSDNGGDRRFICRQFSDAIEPLANAMALSTFGLLRHRRRLPALLARSRGLSRD